MSAAIRRARPDEPFTATNGPTLPRPEPTLAAALSSLASSYCGDPRDWARYYRDAWTYAIVVGWECDDEHEHDAICGADDALREVADQHGWSEDDVAWLRAAHTAYRQAEGR